MKMTSIRYLIKEGFKNTWANRLMTIASVGVLMACMVIIGLAVLITENVNHAIGNLEQQNVVIAYMKDYNWALLEAEIPTSEEGREGADDNGILPSDYVIHNADEANALCDKIKGISNVADEPLIDLATHSVTVPSVAIAPIESPSLHTTLPPFPPSVSVVRDSSSSRSAVTSTNSTLFKPSFERMLSVVISSVQPTIAPAATSNDAT